MLTFAATRRSKLCLPGTLLGALMILGSPNLAVAQGADVVRAAETLHGLRHVAVEVTGFAQFEIPEEPLVAMMTRALRSEGIEVLPPGSYPSLRLNLIQRCCLEVTCSSPSGLHPTQHDEYRSVNISLHFRQRMQLPGQDGKYAGAITWGNEDIQALRRNQLDEAVSFTPPLIESFIKAYRSVNSRR